MVHHNSVLHFPARDEDVDIDLMHENPSDTSTNAQVIDQRALQGTGNVP